jgi:hypothetical protein
MSLLEEDRSDQYLKSLAIEWLGIISCKIKTGYNKLSGDFKTYTPEWICELNDILPIKVDKDTPIKSLALLDQCRKKLLDHVVEERVNHNVIQFYLCNWGFIESVVWTKANKGWEIQQKKRTAKSMKAPTHSATSAASDSATTSIATPVASTTATEESEKKDDDDFDDLDEDTAMADPSTTTDITINETNITDTSAMDIIAEENKWPKENALLLEDTCKYYWLSCLGMEHPFPSVPKTKQYDFPELARSDYNLFTELLASRQTLYTSFNFILSEILICLDKDAVIYRTKALKAIGKIASEVPEIMEEVKYYYIYFSLLYLMYHFL